MKTEEWKVLGFSLALLLASLWGSVCSSSELGPGLWLEASPGLKLTALAAQPLGLLASTVSLVTLGSCCLDFPTR